MTDATRYQTVRLPFRATLMPHRSLSQNGFLIVMAVLGGVSFIAGCVFWALGAWPVMVFFGLDVALVYFAFRWNYRDGGQSERIEVTRSAVTLTREDGFGRRRTQAFDPSLTYVSLVEREDDASLLALVERGRSAMIGAFLTNDERSEVADAVQAALRTARAA
ncbi:MAG: DUF2244 domain-containing protein [Pseudomonadota bacterium]